MYGRHKVKSFELKTQDQELPLGWKPFSSFIVGESVYILARFWERESDEARNERTKKETNAR